MTLRIESQRAIWELFKKGRNPNQISVELGMSRETVRRYCNKYAKILAATLERIKENPEQIEEIMKEEAYRSDKNEMNVMWDALKESLIKAVREQTAPTKTDVKAGDTNVQP